MRRSWEEDRKTLETYGCEVIPLRELEYFIEAEVAKDGNHMEIQWGTDSAYRPPLKYRDRLGRVGICCLLSSDSIQAA